MAEQPVVIQKISWGDLCPWTIIFRTLPIAASFAVLAFALLGVVITPIGWRLSETVFLNEELRKNTQLMEAVRSNHSPYRGVFMDIPDGQRDLNVMGVRLTGPREVFRQYVSPFKSIFSRQTGVRGFFYFLVGSLWTVCVWGFVGVAITRICLIRLTRNEFVGMDDAFEFSMKKWTTVMGAIAAPLVAVALLCIPTFLLGLFLAFDLGVLVAGLLWFIVIAIAAAMTFLLVGLMFGWPLMVSSVGCESQNSFDAMTRSFAYTLQRPLHYLFYALVAILFGGISWIIVATIADGVIGMTYWSTSWGANLTGANADGISRMDLIIEGPGIAANGEATTESSSMYAGRSAIGFWRAGIKSLAAAFLYGLFWCMASAVYLLLRHDVDETEMDEIYLDQEKRTYQLPPLQSDENGIPVVQTPVPAPQESDPVPRGETPDEEISLD